MKRQKQMVLIAGILLVLCLNPTFVLTLQASPKSEKKPQQELMLDSQDRKIINRKNPTNAQNIICS